MPTDDDGGLSPFRIAAVYAVVGGAWIALSDRLVDALGVSRDLSVVLQTAKGWLFVGGSALLIYALVTRRERELRRMSDHRERALQQVSILHRVVRHNLRNMCNVVRGNAEEIERRHSEATQAEAIREHVDRLVEISEKSSQLREVAIADTPERETVDLVAVVGSLVEETSADHPDAEFVTDLPEWAGVRVLPQFGLAVEEVIENAVRHNDRAAPTVRISVEREPGGRTTLDVADDGPGMPEMEEQLLEAGVEQPLFHSQGLGLWLVRILVAESEGSLAVFDDEPRGTVVRMSLESAAG